METRKEFLDSILEINSNYDTKIIGKAFDIANKMHEGQLRKSGEPYIIHPMAVTRILANLGMDDNTLVAGILHDVVEDTEYTKEDLVRDFGEEVAVLVDGVTKIGELVYDSMEARQAETFRKMFLAMSKDIRVLIIKLADRVHNLRTINYMSAQKTKEICTETIEIYAPLAGRLGIYSIKSELEDESMRYLWPEKYKDVKKGINEKKAQRDLELRATVESIEEILKTTNIQYEISGRTKNFYSIYKKMQKQKKQIDEIFDLSAVRVIVNTEADCYSVLGLVHSKWTPLPGRFKDYIASPKINRYQSIHTTVIGKNGTPFEIQIRTHEMHQVAEFGIAAHWKYKEGVKNLQQNEDERGLAWIKQSLEWQKDLDNPSEFLENLKVDLFGNKVFVFTPKGRVMELPIDATPLDFAFKIHTDVGAKCVGAKVNGKMVQIDHTLKNGDVIEIITNPNSKGPSIDWLRIVKSPTARTKIRQWLKKENKGDDIEKGKVALDRYIRKKGYDPKEVIKNSYINKLLKENALKDTDELYVQLANGGTIVSSMANKLFDLYNVEHETESDVGVESIVFDKAGEKKDKHISQHGLHVEGIDGLLIRTARCCNPVPGDEVIGFITKGRGISVHRKDCINIKTMPEEEKERFIAVSWEDSQNEKYSADVVVIAQNRKGMFADLSRICANYDMDLSGVNAKTDMEGNARIHITVEISDTQQMTKLMVAFRALDGVYEVFRA